MTDDPIVRLLDAAYERADNVYVLTRDAPGSMDDTGPVTDLAIVATTQSGTAFEISVNIDGDDEGVTLSLRPHRAGEPCELPDPVVFAGQAIFALRE